MYFIKKILNNNTILITTDDSEGVVICKGIGFGKKNGEEVDIPNNAKVYIMQKSYKTHQFIEKIDDIEAIYIEIAGEVLKYAQDKYHLVIYGQLVPLALVLYYSVKLLNDQVSVSDSKFNDLYFFYPRECDIALKAKEVIKKYTNIDIDDNQINHIAVHLNSCFVHSRSKVSESIIQVISKELASIEKELNIVFNLQSISFIRLLRHIRFNLKNPNRELANINDIIKNEYPYTYDIAENIVNKLSEALGEEVQSKEIGYISLHIEELIVNANK